MGRYVTGLSGRSPGPKSCHIDDCSVELDTKVAILSWRVVWRSSIELELEGTLATLTNNSILSFIQVTGRLWPDHTGIFGLPHWGCGELCL